MMNRYDGLICRISDEYLIRKGTTESKESWITRTIYTVIGIMALASLSDEITDEDTTSITHFKKRIIELASCYCDLYPEVTRFFQNKEELADDIYNTYLYNGWLYHELYRVVMAMPKEGVSGDITLSRCHDLSEHQCISGLGTYFCGVLCDRDASDMFFGNKNNLKEIWNSIVDVEQWTEIDPDISVEYLRMKPPFYYGYWDSKPNRDGLIGIMKTISGGTPLFYLYRYNGTKLVYHQVHSWMTHDIRILSNACLASYGLLPVTRYRRDGEIVYLAFGYLPPIDEHYLWKLYSWPSYDDKRDCNFKRICNSDVFEAIKSIMVARGYEFSED